MKMRTQFLLTMIIFACLLVAAAASTIIIDYRASGLWTILVMVALMLAYFILMYLMFQRRALKSLATLNAGTEIIGAGNLDYVFPIKSKDEIGQLAESINKMTSNLKQVTASKSEMEELVMELKKQTAKNDAMFSSMLVGVGIYDRDGKLLSMNPAGQAMLTYSQSDLDSSIKDRMTRVKVELPDGRPITVEESIPHRALKGENVRDYLFRLHPDNGEMRWINGNGSPIKTESGEITGVVLTIIDETERKKTEDALKESELLLKEVTEGSPDPIFIKDRFSRIIMGNPALLQLWGKTMEEVIGKNDRELYKDPAVGEALMANDSRVMESGVSHVIEERVETSNGFRMYLSTKTPYRDSHGEIIGILGIARDITERKNAEQALKESEAKANALIKYAPTAIYEIDYSVPCFISFNDAMCALSGYSREELMAINPTTLLDDESRNMFAERIKHQAAGEKINETVEYKVIRKDGQILWVILNTSISRDRPHTAMVIGHDITARKKAEEELRRVARELRAISDCNQVMVRATDEQSLYKDICRIMCEAAGYQMAWVGRVEHDEEKSITPTAWNGMEEGYLKNAAITWADVPRGRGPSGLAVRTGKTQFFQDFLTEPAAAPWREAAIKRGYRSSIALPLTDASGDVFAVFTLYATQPGWFNTAEIKLLEELAGDLGFGINVIRTRVERDRMEDELKDTAKQWQATFDSITDMVSIQDRDMRLLRINKAYEAATGMKQADLIGKKCYEVVHGTLGPPASCPHVQTIKTDKPVTKEIFEPRLGWYLEASTSPILDKNGKVTGTVHIAKNITERRKLEIALKDSEQKFRELYSSMNDGLAVHEIIYNEAGKAIDYTITDINPMYEEITGLNKEQAIGKRASVLYGTSEPPYLDVYAGVALTGTPVSFETYFPPMDKFFNISVFSPKNGSFATVFSNITERKKTEKEMAHLASFPELNPSPIVELDKTGRIIYTNQSTKNELPDLPDKGIEHPFIAGIQDIFKQLTGSERHTFDREIEVGKLWYDQRITYIPDEETFRLYGRDITEKKMAEKEIQATLNRFYLVLSGMPLGILMVTEDGVAEYANQTFCEMYGLKQSPEELRNLNSSEVIDIIRPSYFNPDKAVARISDIVVRMEPIREEEVPMINGRTLLRDFIPVSLGENKFGRLWIHRDVTEKKMAEEALRQSNDYLNNLFNYANAPIIVWDPQYHITRFNQAFERLTGLKAEEVIGENLEILFPENMRIHSMEHIREAAAGKRMETEEIPIQQKNGSVRTVLWNSATLFEGNGKTPVATIAQGQDITQRKQAEENLERRTRELEDANKELESFSYSVSHDLREPLRAIDGFTRILDEDYRDKLDEEGQRVLNTILKGTDKMGRLISDLLSFSRVSRQYMSESTVEMHKLAETVCDELKATAGQEREIECKISNLPDAVGDTTMIRQVMTNLVSNALKFTRPREKSIIEIGCLISEKENIYYIKDNGVGFNDQYTHKLFNMFQRLHPQEQFEGTGVGLAIVQRIIQRHGGRVWAESKQGEGATFYFALPGK